jgi:hypothetical protein
MDANDPLPYYSGLAKVLHGPTLALVLTYLEWHHPAPESTPQDSPEALFAIEGAPVTIDCDQVSAALGIARRTLHIALCCLGCWWSTEEERSRAARVNREFLHPAHTWHDPIKLYSITGTKGYAPPGRKLAIRRNYPKLFSTLALAGIIPLDNQTQQDQNHCSAINGMGKPSSTVPRLPDILRSSLPDWGDRRRDRWDRWRRETGRKSRNPGRFAGVDKRKEASQDRREITACADKGNVGQSDTESDGL